MNEEKVQKRKDAYKLSFREKHMNHNDYLLELDNKLLILGNHQKERLNAMMKGRRNII